MKSQKSKWPFSYVQSCSVLGLGTQCRRLTSKLSIPWIACNYIYRGSCMPCRQATSKGRKEESLCPIEVFENQGLICLQCVCYCHLILNPPFLNFSPTLPSELVLACHTDYSPMSLPNLIIFKAISVGILAASLLR